MKSFIQLVNEKKADKNSKEFEYAKSKESKTFKGTVTQGADKGRSYTIERNPSPKGSRKGIPINKPRNADKLIKKCKNNARSAENQTNSENHEMQKTKTCQ